MINLLLGFDGRISRMQFWIGMLIVAGVELTLMLVLDVPYFPIEQKPLSVRLIEFAIQLVTIYPTAAIVVKRLHDRNQPGFYAVWLLGLIMLVALTNLFGLTDDPKESELARLGLGTLHDRDRLGLPVRAWLPPRHRRR